MIEMFIWAIGVCTSEEELVCGREKHTSPEPSCPVHYAHKFYSAPGSLECNNIKSWEPGRIQSLSQ
jgi:hypothetical protein